MTEPVGPKGVTADPIRKVIAKIGDTKQANTGAVPRSAYERIMRCMQPIYSGLPGRSEADVGLARIVHRLLDCHSNSPGPHKS